MKKVIFVFAIATALVACGSNNSTAINVADSTAVAADTTAVADSAVVAPAVDSVAK